MSTTPTGTCKRRPPGSSTPTIPPVLRSSAVATASGTSTSAPSSPLTAPCCCRNPKYSVARREIVLSAELCRALSAALIQRQPFGSLRRGPHHPRARLHHHVFGHGVGPL